MLSKIRHQFLLPLFVLTLFLVSMPSVHAENIQNIKVEGLNRIEEGTVRAYLQVREGDAFDPMLLNDSLKALFATDFFADVAMDKRGQTLVVQVKENPVINQIAFEGNEALQDEDLNAELRLRSRMVYTRSKIKDEVERIVQLYRRSGYFAVSVEPQAILLDQNRLNIVFEIDEGPKSEIKAINFIGNQKYTDSQLRDVLLSKESRWYRFMTSTDTYDEDRVAFDEELLRRFYLSQGYPEFKVTSSVAELTPNKEDFFLTFTVSEGPRFKFGDVAFDNNLEDLDITEMEEIVADKKGEWYDAQWVEDKTIALTDTAANLQYGFVEIEPNLDLDRENQIVNLTYVINESPRVFVERVNIRGNVRTLDDVIRREILLVEGDPYNLTKVKRSEQNIKDLGYFADVTLETLPGSQPDQAVLDIEVTEQSTGELSIGAGFSSLDGPLANFRVRERNFLGKGQSLLFATTIAGDSQQFDISFTEPYFMDRKLMAGVDLFHLTRDFQDESSFDQTRSGFSLRMGYPLAEFLSQSIRYRFENNELENIEVDASRYIREQEGERATSEVTQTLMYDRLNSRREPTDGYMLSLATSFAGLGGDAQYISNVASGAIYFPFYDNSVVLNLGTEVGQITAWGDESIVITERFFVGGTNLRGFDQSGIGPRDVTTGDALGGNRFARATAELSFPIGLPEELGVKGHLFTDMGTLGEIDVIGSEIRDDETIRLTTGVGVSWASPLGPIKAYFGIPIMKEDYDETRSFQLDFGTAF